MEVIGAIIIGLVAILILSWDTRPRGRDEDIDFDNIDDLDERDLL